VNEKERALERAQYRIGTHGAASDGRKIDLASVDTAALIAQFEYIRQASDRRAERRTFRHDISY
jgi:hypothetical protein